MEQTELERVAEAILFAAGEPVELERIAIAAECDLDEAEQAVRSLMDRLSYERARHPYPAPRARLSDVLLG